VTRGLGRQALIQDLGINRNTLDSRLHACRRELRGLLAHDGVAI
jgi:DNA-directed RNA polymerase specialized sigma24 family protein